MDNFWEKKLMTEIIAFNFTLEASAKNVRPNEC